MSEPRNLALAHTYYTYLLADSFLKHAALQSTREAEWMTMAIGESASFLFYKKLMIRSTTINCK
jgi:hypothetical protein